MEDRHQAKGAEGEGQHHADHGDAEGLGPHRHQFLQLTFKTREEEQGIKPQRGHRLQGAEALVVEGWNLLHRHMRKAGHHLGERSGKLHLGLRRHQKVKARSTNQHASKEFPKNRGELKAHQHLSEGAGRHEDQHEAKDADQRFRQFEVVTADFAQQGGQQHQAGHVSRRTLMVIPPLNCSLDDPN